MGVGRFTIPTEENFIQQSTELAEKWGADAIRNSDGTHLDADVIAMGKRIYGAYFPNRGHNYFMKDHMDAVPMVYLMSERTRATADTVDVPLMVTYFDEQLTINRDADPVRFWEVIDRTSGEVLPADRWELDPHTDVVHIRNVQPMHEYTVTFLAYVIWDPVQMYNHITNDWGDKEHEIAFDPRHPEIQEFMLNTLDKWLVDNPHVDVVRFTTFFYQFTLIFNNERKEQIVDWTGFAVTVSPRALDEFEKEYGYRMRPEHFVDGGSYGSSFVYPSKEQRDWLDFTANFVHSLMKQMVERVQAAGKEAMMFLGDQWIGTEPYSSTFPNVGMDAIVGSVGDGTTTRMIADIKGVKYHEGRFLPYFFPDSFYEGADPSIEAWDNWRKARRAILRSPLERMGYGGYLSLAAKFPKFVDDVATIANEFRDIYDKSGGTGAQAQLTVALLDAWGARLSWQEFTVAHALPNKYNRSFYGILEALSGMRVNVRFLSFDDVLANGIDPEIDVIINAGPQGTAYSGAEAWKNPELVALIRSWVSSGKGFVGVGQPSAVEHGGRLFQLADILGVDQEIYHSLNVDKYWPELTEDHFVIQDIPRESLDFGEAIMNTFPISQQTTVISGLDGQVQLAVNKYDDGRGVYLSGLPYSALNARLLERALFYAAHKEGQYAVWGSSNPECEVAYFAEKGIYAVVNNSEKPQHTVVSLPGGKTATCDLAPSAIEWTSIS
ncbi:1,3-beta-galactosyl-N-acetylhexosamine phosphorylase [Arcanobacterium phocae]|uniref:1,3-beta-galactosyl-N-acetylhexosamine phosphorylase n=1 Tax=Arcanobacterium phocae TaxID=131112 RepID=UPI001C0ED55C|nr:1,3-beta-galactosyl-N-acetylhexosamine phosphorylase [Arcanobacterium phocae]